MANEKRLIDCEQAKRATYEEIFWTESEQAVVRNFLAKLPRVDAEEVVRCKDCIEHRDFPSLPNTVICDRMCAFRKMDDFCSYGERKDDGK